MAEKDDSQKEETGKESGGGGGIETNATSSAAKDSAPEKKSSNKKKKTEEQPDVETLQAQLQAERDRCLRLSAEFDNYKKRSAREMTEFRKFANESVFKKLLTVVDNLERALDSGEKQSDPACILEGIQLTHKELLKLFETFNVKPLESEGAPFDPAFHQAVTQQESDKHADNTVISELQKGYLINDRLLRPSMVVVSKSVATQDK